MIDDPAVTVVMLLISVALLAIALKLLDI